MAATLQATYSDSFSLWKLLNFDNSVAETYPNGPINTMPVLIQIMAWRRTGHKPRSEQLMA